MNYCEWIKCGDYTAKGCKAFGVGVTQCKTKIEAEPYADACVAARDKEWLEWGDKVAKMMDICPVCWKERKKALEASNG